MALTRSARHQRTVPVPFSALLTPRRSMSSPLGFGRGKLAGNQCPVVAVRPEGANHQWRRNPPRKLSIDLVADERLGRVTGRAGARSLDLPDDRRREPAITRFGQVSPARAKTRHNGRPICGYRNSRSEVVPASCAEERYRRRASARDTTWERAAQHGSSPDSTLEEAGFELSVRPPRGGWSGSECRPAPVPSDPLASA